MEKKQDKNKVDAVSGADVSQVKKPSEYIYEEPPRQFIKVRDKRKTDVLTGLPIDSGNRKHAEIPLDYVEMTVSEAKKRGVDPGTALAIGLQESGYKKEWLSNPFQMGKYDQFKNIIEQSVQFMAKRNNEAKKLGKTSEEDIIQSYNGYGKLSQKGKMYGIDTNKTIIDMDKTPLYGKTVKSLRDSVIMQNPDILKIINRNEINEPVKKLKEGGKVEEKSEDGITGLTELFDKSKGLSTAASTGSDVISGILDRKKENILSNVDARKDPSIAMGKANMLDTGKAIASGAAKGAMFGPWGALAGAAVAGVGRLIGVKKQREQQEAATEKWSGSWSSKTAASIEENSYKNGGKIEGKGTGKSDSIPMKTQPGSFIVPAENAEIGEELGVSFLGWDKKERVSKNNGGTNVKVSNGEVIFTPEEVSILKYHGVDLDALAPKTENKIKMKKGGIVKGYANAGKVDGTTTDWIHDKENDLVINDKTKTAYDRSGAEYAFNIDENKYMKMRSGSPYGIDIYSGGTKKSTGDDPNWIKNIPEFAGALQVAGGAFGLMQAGKTPDITVSKTLNKLSGQVRRLSEFGYEPAVLNALNTEIDNTRRSLSKDIEAEGSNSALEKMAKLNVLLSTTIDKKAGLAFSNAAEKSRKWADVMKIDTMKAGQEFDINKIKIDDWYKNQEVFAGMVTAGISNIVGSRQLKAEQDTLREIGGNKPKWTKPTKP